MKQKRQASRVAMARRTTPPVAAGAGVPSRTWRWGAALVVLGLWAWLPSLDGVFVFDDRPAILENASIRSWSTVLAPPPASPLSGRPLANATFAVNYHLGHDITGYRAVNVGIHLGAGLLLFGVLRRTPQIPTAAAAATAALWMVHPLTTGAVTYVVQRVEVLMGFLYLLTVYCAVRANGSRRVAIWRAGAVLACAAGMATKEVMVTAPILVWLWHVVFAAAPWNALRDPRRMFYLGLAATWLVLAALVLSGTEATAALRAAATGDRAFGWTPWTYLWTQAAVVVHYLRLALVPHPLVLDYYGWPRVESPLEVWPQVLLLCLLVAATALALARRRPAGYAGTWFFLILAPTSSLVPIPTEIAAEHRMYLPLAAVVAVVVMGIVAAGMRLVSVESASTRRWIGLSLATAAVLALGVATRARASDYRSEESLWLDTVTKRPGNARARINYGILLMKAGRYADAEAQMRAAVDLPADDETRAQVHVQLGAALCAQGRCREGIPHLERALRLHPEVDDADAVLAQAFSESGDLARALHFFRRAVVRHPDLPPLLARAAWLLATAPDEKLRDPRYAEQLADRAVRLTARRDVAALESLAAAYAAQGRFAEAAATAAEAFALAQTLGDVAAAATLREQAEFYRSQAR
ncbi:MAG TPA: tetratricopeptide repeat protein [Vicinamibacterales bacterium]|nr:tetratricopeptide repeat protein [Vicinamibacterales bacterium]